MWGVNEAGGEWRKRGERFFKKPEEKTKVTLNEVALMRQSLKNLGKLLLTGQMESQEELLSPSGWEWHTVIFLAFRMSSPILIVLYKIQLKLHLLQIFWREDSGKCMVRDYTQMPQCRNYFNPGFLSVSSSRQCHTWPVSRIFSHLVVRNSIQSELLMSL